jgi:hypothetical protein
MRPWMLIPILVSFPVFSAETKDREKSPFEFVDPPSILAIPLAQMVQTGDRVLRIYVQYDQGDELSTDIVYVVTTNADNRAAKFAFEKRTKWNDADGEAQVIRSEGTRHLTEAELASFRAAFEPLRICSSVATGKDGPAGWTVQIEFANQTRHCYAERWSPNWENYAPEFLSMSELMYTFLDPLAKGVDADE